MHYYLAVDVGTTSVKAVAFNTSAEMICKKDQGYPMISQNESWCEQDAGVIYNATLQAINEVIAELIHQPQFVCFSAAMHSLLMVDENGKTLTNAVIWADNRAENIAEELLKKNEGGFFYNKTGVPVHAMSPFCKLLWYKKNEKELFASANKFISIKEYIFFKLTGRFVVDTGIASATGLLNIHSLKWDEDVLNYAGIDSNKLSEIVSTKSIFYVNEKHFSQNNVGLQLSSETPLVIGSSDGACANIAINDYDKNAIVITAGTSVAVRILSKNIILDKSMRTFCYHAYNDEYITGGAGNNGGVVLQWLKEKVLISDESIDQIINYAHNINAGSDGLIFMPYLLGERAPVWNAKATGAFFGLKIDHSKAHFINAVLEGIIFGIYSIGKIILEKDQNAEIYAGGGFAQNVQVLQMIADVFNKKISTLSSSENSALGAMIIGTEALGLSYQSKVKNLQSFYPDKVKHEIYLKEFKKMQRLYELIKNEF